MGVTTNTPSSVLIVEDERIIALDVQQMLKEMGYEAYAIASSIEEALGHASRKRPSIVLMDIRIRGQKDGIDTAMELRKRFDVPVIYLTAHADERTLQRAKETEPYGYLLKPVKPMELRSAIEVSLHRHAMEKQLRERERWFSTTLRSIADAVISVDLAGQIVFMNQAAEMLVGTTLAAAIGRPAREVIRLIDGNGTGSELPLDRALNRQEPVELLESRLVTGGAENRIISDSAAPVMDDEEMLGAVMVFRDITEQKILQKQVELSDRLSSLGTLAAGVAHEVNNPLAVVIANATIVLEELLRFKELAVTMEASDEIVSSIDEAVRAQVEVESASHRIRRIVSDLKAFSRPSEKPSAFADVGKAVDWALRATSREFRHKAIVTSRIDEIPYARIDETRLGQVLVNLLINAAHSIPPGNFAENRVEVRATGAADGKITIEISDTGSGMMPEVLEHIFDPFFTTKPVGKGTGLGLSICHGILKSVGGDIKVKSTANKGTTFTLLLTPALEQPSPAAVVRPKILVRGKILVIDDEEMVTRTLTRILRDHQVVSKDNAEEALNLITSGESFDIILCDVMMPTMTGIDFYQVLRDRHPEHAGKVVFLSGGALTTKTEEFLGSVGNRRIDKPFDVLTIHDAVQAQLQHDAERVINS